ncbi:MAG: helix-turn-helix domain-containing protein [Roseobacter sp.]
MESLNITRLTALSHPGRLALFRLLVRRYPDEVPAGEIAQALGYKPNTASVYLSSLLASGLIANRRQGTSLLYRADLSVAEDLMQYLFSDCCRDRLDLNVPDAHLACAASQRSATKTVTVLFTCSGNASRSLCAQSILQDTAPDRYTVFSAGHHPAQTPNPAMLELLTSKGHQTASLRCDNIADFQQPTAPRIDIVITLCDRAAHEECPPWTGQPVTTHWGTTSLSHHMKTGVGKAEACEEIYRNLATKIRSFSQLDLHTLHRPALQNALDRISNPTDGTILS